MEVERETQKRQLKSVLTNLAAFIGLSSSLGGAASESSDWAGGKNLEIVTILTSWNL